MYIKSIFKQTINNFQYSKLYTHSFGTDTPPCCFRPPGNNFRETVCSHRNEVFFFQEMVTEIVERKINKLSALYKIEKSFMKKV